MELDVRLNDLAKVAREHRKRLETEEAAKNALVMPFLRALGYDVFNPGEVVPEFTCDVGTKKGEKVDYAICENGSVKMLVECKPANTELSLKNASQLYRYFSVTEARVAVLTNGIDFKFYTDIDAANKMDEKPFFSFQIDTLKKHDIKTLEGFTKSAFDIDKIVTAASNLKLQSLVYKELEKEFFEPSDEFVRLIAGRIHQGRLTQTVKESFQAAVQSAISSLIRDKVNDRLTSALSASNPVDDIDESDTASDNDVETTEEEIAGFNIVRAIASKSVDPKRVVMRDQRSYCAILLDDNNRRTVVRLHFNSKKNRYLGVFSGKDETRITIDDPIDIYQHSDAILTRIKELLGGVE